MPPHYEFIHILGAETIKFGVKKRDETGFIVAEKGSILVIVAEIWHTIGDNIRPDISPSPRGNRKYVCYALIIFSQFFGSEASLNAFFSSQAEKSGIVSFPDETRNFNAYEVPAEDALCFSAEFS